MVAAGPAAMAAAAAVEGPCSVYFCGSIRGGREDQALYARIVSRLRRYGKVLTEHVAAAELDPRGEGAWGWRPSACREPAGQGDPQPRGSLDVQPREPAAQEICKVRDM